MLIFIIGAFTVKSVSTLQDPFHWCGYGFTFKSVITQSGPSCHFRGLFYTPLCRATILLWTCRCRYCIVFPRAGSTYGPNWHRPPLLTDKSCKFSLFEVILGLFSGYISHLPPFGSRPPLFTYPGSTPVPILIP